VGSDRGSWYLRLRPRPPLRGRMISLALCRWCAKVVVEMAGTAA